MKANELRIGNLVKVNLTPHICKVLSLHSHHIGIEDTTNGFQSKYSQSLISPIPLTEEWLERFGFRKIPETNRFYLDDKNTPQTIYIDLSEKDTQFGSNEEYDVNPCQYVHQLQNLYFALTGEELELKN